MPLPRGRLPPLGASLMPRCVAVLALGAQAAVLGTRFLASTESRAHPHYKQK
jgi:Nitronate monooxygenase